MIAGLDSATPPSLAAVKAGAATDVRLWSGYIATKPNVGLYHAWSIVDFDIARQAGSEPIAFCSGWDDPVAIKAMAAAWRVKPCLDVEGGIRPDGPWVPAWLAASGAGLYGNYGVHTGRTARFHGLAAYPTSGDGHTTWWSSTPRPSGPCFWQWCGTHTEFGTGCDRGDYDDWFAGNSDSGVPDMEVTDPNFQALIYRVAVFAGAIKPADVPADHKAYVAGVVPLTDIVAQLSALPATIAKDIVVPAPVIDSTALANTIAAGVLAQIKPPVASQAVKDWWAQLTHWLGLA